MRLSTCLVVLLASGAWADVQRDRFSAGGYFRIMTRPDFQGGDSRLGFSNLYGRLLNEGPWGALELRLDVLQAVPGSNEIWASVHTKVEGGSFLGTDPGNGRLDRFAFTQLYVKAGNLLFERVTWQLGTLDSYFGELGLYDARPAQLFLGTVGLSAFFPSENVDVMLAVGDSGYSIRGAQYSSVLTAGGMVRTRVGRHLELGGGAQVNYEPQVEGNRFAPHTTPNVRYEDFFRREVARHFFEENPAVPRDFFPEPLSTSAQSFKLVGYLGFGKLGPLRWNSFFINYLKIHPDNFYRETFENREYIIYTKSFTDERYEVNAGNEMLLSVVPGRLDAVWSVLAGRRFNVDNDLAAGEDNLTFYSTVLRLQLYLVPTVHWLAESSLAREISDNGNLYREHVDSVFQSTSGAPDTRGLEFGDSNVRNTWQLKTGLVLNPQGIGIFTRPSMRFLYGLQYSSQQDAYGNGFSAHQDLITKLKGQERHFHHVVAIEAEGWF